MSPTRAESRSGLKGHPKIASGSDRFASLAAQIGGTSTVKIA
jgi:hypothetical protein